MDTKRQEKLQAIEQWEASKPRNDAEWAEDVKAESLDVKFTDQLEDMQKNLLMKLPSIEKDIDVFENFPDVIRYKLTEQFKQDLFLEGEDSVEGKTLQEWIDEEFESQRLMYQWKRAKIQQSLERIDKEIFLRKNGFLTVDVTEKIIGGDPRRSDIDRVGSRIRSPIGTIYYIDADNGDNGNAGTSPVTAFRTLDQFTENARSSGDIAILRGGMTNRYDDGSDLSFTSDGYVANPICIMADYGDAWGDHVDISGTATATVVFGSKTITFSASVTGVISAGDMIYVSGDNNLEYAYEVANVSTNTVTLYLPYKGMQAGSGRTVINMRGMPIWNLPDGDFQWNFDGDDFWKVQGLKIQGTDVNGVIEIDGSCGHEIMDCSFIGDATSINSIRPLDSSFFIFVNKCRSQSAGGFLVPTGDSFGVAYCKDILTDNTFFVGAAGSFVYVVADSVEFTTALINITTSQDPVIFYSRNSTLTLTVISSGGNKLARVFSEDSTDVGNTLNRETRFHNSTNSLVLQSESSIVRSGGSDTSIRINPTPDIRSNWELSRLCILDIPIYATTSQKTYEIFFKVDDVADFTVNPTAAELWIEVEAWGHATNKSRKITKSSGTVNFTGSTSWQSLSVTVTPEQEGIAYLRVWYAKPKETPSNIFYVDPIPVIT